LPIRHPILAPSPRQLPLLITHNPTTGGPPRSKLPGIEKRLRVLIDWAISPFFARDIALTSTDRTPRVARRPARRGPGQIV
jgi:hypothetical protein